ncbi:MAG TPA: YaiO family outer membrane beta-barrel protein [Ramlibacter sp.]|jgi:YaiO family outer membrane protein
MRIAALPLLALPVLACAQPDVPFDRAAVTAEHSGLDRGLADWNSLGLRLERHWSRREVAQLELTRTRRFGLEDTELAIGGSAALAPAVTGSMRLAYSDTHRVLPRASLAAALQYEFRPAWLLHGGLRHTRYATTQVDQGSAMLEHYFGNYSALAAVHAVRAFGQTRPVVELRAARYYGQGSSVGLIASSGDEAAQVAAGTVALTRVRSVAIVGRHALGQGPWALRYGLHQVRQGGAYTRSGASLGVERDF